MAVQGTGPCLGNHRECFADVPSFRCLKEDVLQVEGSVRGARRSWPRRPVTSAASLPACDPEGSREQGPLPARELPFRRWQDCRLSSPISPGVSSRLVGAPNSPAPQYQPPACFSEALQCPEALEALREALARPSAAGGREVP